MTVEAFLFAFLRNDAGELIAETSLRLLGKPGPDGWTVDVSRPATPERFETVLLPNIEATARHVLAALYQEGPTP
ncbi:MAG: hypothetical protein M3Q71_08350 [Chloroflexota bacterium]|nr:hypothetical protein [Chloroflexota bacterium]